jgi:hypothetical protein
VDRTSHSKTSSSKRQKLKAPIQDVTIQIGLMVAKDGNLTVKRGSSLPLKVQPAITANQLLGMAVEKQSRFNQGMVKDPIGYKLLYHDKREVDTIPGKEEPFSLQSYKEDIGKPYTRIIFFLCSNIDYLDYVTCSEYPESEDSRSGGESPKRGRRAQSTVTQAKKEVSHQDELTLNKEISDTRKPSSLIDLTEIKTDGVSRCTCNVCSPCI